MTQLTDCATEKLNLCLSYSNTLPPRSFHPFLWIKYSSRSVRVFYYHCDVRRSVTVRMRRTSSCVCHETCYPVTLRGNGERALMLNDVMYIGKKL